jgi:prevent-host-death family protein
MEISLKELRIQPGRILSMTEDGTEVVITVRGVPKAKIVPIKTKASKEGPDTSSFGLWADHDDMDDVDGYIRNLRKGRQQ